MLIELVGKNRMSQNWRKLERSELSAPNGFLTNPTVLLFFSVIGLFYYSIYLFVTRDLSPVTVIIINSLCLYAIYTVTHEAIHDIAHKNKSINFALGFIGAAHEGITFPLLKLIHPQHHLYTNHPEKDPDYVIGKKPRWALPLWILIRLTHDNWFMVKRKLWAGQGMLLAVHIFTVLLQLTVIAYSIKQDMFDDLLVVWIIPLVIGGILVEFTVAWLVHFPHDSQNTFEHTRNYPGILWQFLTLNQNYHLVHHLWPKIPWFRYHKYIKTAQIGRDEFMRSKNIQRGE